MTLMKLDMVEVPEGEFIMGANTDNDNEAEVNEEPERLIWLSTYYIQRTPVTIKQWMEFMTSTSYNWGFYEEVANFSSSDLCPITNVSWDEADAFTKWLSSTTGDNYALPTEAQWEKACRGEKGQLYPWGSEQPEEYDIFPPVATKGVPVGTRLDRQSPYGCLDMWQNVAEWCLDWYDETPYEFQDQLYYHDLTKKVNPIASGEGEFSGVFKVWRGGCHYCQSGWPRCSYRGFTYPYERYLTLGFRVVLNS